ncbi:MAG: hypothetical protein ACD_46C00425G0001, partial [uncultured bacterium]
LNVLRTLKITRERLPFRKNGQTKKHRMKNQLLKKFKKSILSRKNIITNFAIQLQLLV